MASTDRSGDPLESWVPFAMLVAFGVCFWRTDLQALGYGIIVFLMVLFGLSAVAVAGAWILVRTLVRSDDELPSRGVRILRSGWFWAYAVFLAGFWGLWPWR